MRDVIYEDSTQSEMFKHFLDNKNYMAAMIIFKKSHLDNDYLDEDLDEYFDDIMENCNDIRIVEYFLDFMLDKSDDYDMDNEEKYVTYFIKNIHSLITNVEIITMVNSKLIEKLK